MRGKERMRCHDVRFLLLMVLTTVTTALILSRPVLAADPAIRVISPPDGVWVTEKNLFLAGTVQGAKLEPYKHEEARLKMREGGSIPVKHHGGLIKKSGPVFAQKGEVIYPTHFTDGETVQNDLRE